MAYRPILERARAEVCIGTMTMVVGLMSEMDENEFAPSLCRSVGGTDV